MASLFIILAGCSTTGAGPSVSWTQADADAAKAAQESIASSVCAEPLWEMFMMAGDYVTDANNVAKRSEYSSGLDGVIDALQLEHDKGGGGLLDPDLIDLIEGLKSVRQKLQSPMTQAEFDPLFTDLVEANRVACWHDTREIEGRVIAIYPRAMSIQAWVDQNVKK